MTKLTFDQQKDWSDELPDGWQLVQSIDLMRGGYKYSVTGPRAPRALSFRFFPTRREAVQAAMAEASK